MINKLINIGANIINDEFDGEVYINEESLIPASHEYLFIFLETDLNILEQYALSYLECIDFNEPEKSIKGDTKKRRHIFEELSKMHPYYNRNFSNITYDINFAIYKYVKGRLSSGVDLNALLKFVCLPDYTGSVDVNYLTEMNINGNADKPVFSDLIEYQKALNRMVFMLFDCTNRDMVMPSISQRASFYCALYHNEYNPLLSYTVEKTFTKPQSLRQITAAIEFSDDVDVYEDIQNLITNPTSDIPENLMSLIVAASQSREDCLQETVVVKNLTELLNYEVFNMIEQNTHIKRCKHCNRYFIIDKLTLEYCDRIMPGEFKPCNEIGKTRTYQSKLASDELMAMYRRAYKTHFARIRAGKLTQEAFKTWSTEATDKQEEVRGGHMTVDDYAAWLKI